MRSKVACVAFCLTVWAGWPPGSVSAGVAVLANRTDQEVQFTITLPAGKTKDYAVKAGDLAVIPLDAPADVSFAAGKRTRRYPLQVNAVYYFGDFPSGLNLEEIRFGATTERPSGSGKPAETPGKAPAPSSAAAPLKLSVKILVDEEEPGVRRVWEDRLRKRVEAASAILEAHCRVQLEIVAVGEWESDNHITDFAELLRDFERKVKPQPARLAIGFTSQRLPAGPRHKLGGIARPLHTHILIREWTPPNERDRLEVLVHEIGHFLGAAHSPELESVMRPLIGEDRPTLRRARLGFDPVNTLVINLVAEEVRSHGVQSLEALSPATRARLTDVYQDLARTLPDDPNAAKYVRLLARGGTEAGPAASVRELTEGAEQIVAAVVRAAEKNQRLPVRGDRTEAGPYRLTGDELTAYYVRAAAVAARQLPADQAAPAYLLGLGVALDTSALLRKNVLTRGLWENVESDAERKGRLDVLGLPTVRGRHDFAQHFFVSAALVAVAGPKAAEAAGIVKELLDAQGDSGFSFADLAADLAGVAFAVRVKETPGLLPRLAASFTVADYALDPTGLEDGLTKAEFARKYGGITDERFQKKLEGLKQRVRELPAYETATEKQPTPAKPR